MLKTTEGFLCRPVSAIGVLAGHTSGSQLAGTQTLLIMSLNNRAEMQGAFSVCFLGSCKSHNNSIVDTGINVHLVRRIFNFQEFTAN